MLSFKFKMKLGIRLDARWLLVFLLAVTLGRNLQSADALAREYRLRFYTTHTNERLDIVYRPATVICRTRWRNWTAIFAIPLQARCIISSLGSSTCSTI